MTGFSLPSPLAEALRQTSSTLVVTGGGGWIGRNILEILDPVLGDAMDARVHAFGSKNRPLTLRSGRTIDCRSLDALENETGGEKIFFHCAFMTRDRVADTNLDEYIETNERLSSIVAKAVRHCDLRGFFMPSSGAVYRSGTHTLDTNIKANPYGLLKQKDEQKFLSLAGKAPACIPRVFNLSGAFINKTDTYAIASMIKAALASQPITIRAAHRVVRSYIHVLDLLSLALSMLLAPKEGDVAIFDTKGAESLELSDLAELIRAVLQKPHLPIKRPLMNPAATADVYVGQAEPMTRLFASHGLRLHSMPQQIRDTADYLSKQEEI